MNSPNHFAHPQESPSHVLVARIRHAGLIAELPVDQQTDLLLEVGDALLASPILVVAISVNHHEPASLLHAYRKRFGDNLLVGATDVSTRDEGAIALGAGADFLITTRYETALHADATACGALYIPPARAIAAVPALHQMGAQMATVSSLILQEGYPWPCDTQPALLVNIDAAAGVLKPYCGCDENHNFYSPKNDGSHSEQNIEVPSEHLLDRLTFCAQSGAAAVQLGPHLLPTEPWSMPTFIRTARSARQAWFQGAATIL